MGPGCTTEAESQAKANYLISVANSRKDCVATVGAHRGNVVNVTNTDTQTNNLVNYFSSLQSSSYAVFDSGYKYMYDRFNNKFRYVPCNGDIAGLMVRTSIVAYPWFSPAGQQRGILNNAVKLAYNPNKTQRDRLYPKRINSIITHTRYSEHYSSEIKLHLLMHPHSIESTSVACSSRWSKHCREQHKHNSLNSMMS